MAYSTGSYTSPHNLLDLFRQFLFDNGWTINMYAAVGTGFRLHASKGSVFVNFRSYLNESIPTANSIENSTISTSMAGVAGYISTGFDAGQLWNAQPGRPFYNASTRGGFTVGMNAAGPAYHFFAYPDSDEVFMVTEFIAGRIQMFGFGTIKKYNPSAVGGQWMSMPTRNPTYGGDLPSTTGIDQNAATIYPFRSASYAANSTHCSSFIKVNIDGHDGWAGEGRYITNSSTPLACAGVGTWDEALIQGASSVYNWQTVMLPQILMISRDAAIAYSPFGEIINFRRLDITNYNLGEEFSLGPDTWKTFPLFQKNGYSFTRGFALKKVL